MEYCVDLDNVVGVLSSDLREIDEEAVDMSVHTVG